MLSGTGQFACEPACEVEAPLCGFMPSLSFQGGLTLILMMLLGGNSLGRSGAPTCAGVYRLGAFALAQHDSRTVVRPSVGTCFQICMIWFSWGVVTDLSKKVN